MFKIIFTSDHEIHGNGEGSPAQLIVEPTDRMLDLFNRYGAKLTIMADVAEILKFQAYKEQHGDDRFAYHAVAGQLKTAIRTGHDVQLHLHSSYFNATWNGRRWEQDYTEYDLANLPYERVEAMIRCGKDYLESLLRPVRPDYRCFAFRAANWSMSPSRNIVRALVQNGFCIETSVFKYGQRQGLVSFDYSPAHDALRPWPASHTDICRADASSTLWEFPIYAEARPLWSFVCLNRFYRAALGRVHPIPDDAPAPAGNARSGSMANSNTNSNVGAKSSRWRRFASLLLGKHAWKMDFNQCSGQQLIAGLKRAEAFYGHGEYPLPVVLIGHSKLFNRLNARSLRPFLEFVAAHPQRFAFGTFGDFRGQIQIR